MPRARLTYTGATQTLANGGTILFNGNTFEDGISYDASDGGIEFHVPGTYRIEVSVTAITTAAGTQAVQLYTGGSAAVGAFAADDTDAVGDRCNLAFSDLVTVRPGSGIAKVYVKVPNALGIENAIVTIG